MNYQEAYEWITRWSQRGSIYGLRPIQSLAQRIDNPQENCSIIHIAGTNGKGSVGAFLAAILANAGLRVGRYVSPTTRGYCERIQYISKKKDTIATTWISECQTAKYLSQLRQEVEAMASREEELPTAFEIETMLAFMACSRKDCDILLLEAGLGGRLDATNLIKQPIATVLTSISLDHCALLGDTVEQIAREKAGISKTGVPLIYATCKESVAKVIVNECEQRGGIPIAALPKEDFDYNIPLGISGTYQRENASIAVSVCRELQRQGYVISEQAICKGFMQAKWPGRFEVMSKNPCFILDGAHNPDAARALYQSLKEYQSEACWVGVMGVFRDKDYKSILQIMLPCIRKLYVITPNETARALPSLELKECAQSVNEQLEVVDAGTFEEAIRQIREQDEEPVICFGSLSYQNQVYSFWDNHEG